MPAENFQQKIKEIAKKYNLNLVLLFGSQVKNKKYLHRESDFDIAYLSRRELTGKEIIDLNCDFIDFFHCDRIDLVDLKKDNPLLKYEIAQNSKLLYGEEMDYLEFKATAFKSYIDHQPLFKLEDILIRKRHEFLKESIYGK